MSEINQQSTDRLNDNTNPRLTNVALQGQVTLSDLGSGFFAETVTFPLDSDYANLDVEFWLRFQESGGLNPVRHYKCPFTIPNDTNTIKYSCWVVVSEPQKTGTYDLVFNLFTTDTALVDPIIYYRLNTNKIAEGGLTFV